MSSIHFYFVFVVIAPFLLLYLILIASLNYFLIGKSRTVGTISGIITGYIAGVAWLMIMIGDETLTDAGFAPLLPVLFAFIGFVYGIRKYDRVAIGKKLYLIFWILLVILIFVRFALF